MEHPLFFYNNDFENAVREELHIYDRPIYVTDAVKIKKLCCADFSFSPKDYEILYFFENLEELIFEQHQGFVDFSVFTPLKKLKYLTVVGGIFPEIDLINIGALQELHILEHLSVGDFANIDLADIGEVKQLRELRIGWGNSVTNADAIKELKQLSFLELYDLKIKRLDFLSELSRKVSVNIGGLEIEENFDIEILKKFEHCDWEMLSINGRIEE